MNMLVPCLTVIGLIKIYTRFEKVTTFADNFLAFVCVGYFISTVCAYLAVRSEGRSRRPKLAKAADLLFLASLCCTGAVAIFMIFALEG